MRERRRPMLGGVVVPAMIMLLGPQESKAFYVPFLSRGVSSSAGQRGIAQPRARDVAPVTAIKSSDPPEESFDLFKALGQTWDGLANLGKEWVDPDTVGKISGGQLMELKPETEALLDKAVEAVQKGGEEAEAKYEELVQAFETMRSQQKLYIAEREKEVELIRSYSESIKELNTKVYKLESELRETRRCLKEVQNIRRDLSYRLEQAQSTLATIRKSSTKAMEALQLELNQEKEAAAAMREREANLIAERDRAHAQIASLMSEISEGGQGEEEREALEARLAALTNSAVAAKIAWDEAELEKRLEKPRERWATWFERTFGDMERKVQGLELAMTQFTSVKEQVGQYEEQLATAQGALEEMKEKAVKWEARASEEGRGRTEAEASAARVQKTFESEVSRLKDSIAKMTTQLSAAETRLEAAAKETAQLKVSQAEEIKALEAKFKTRMEEDTKEMAQSLEAKTKALAALEMKSKDESAQLAKLQASVDRLQAKLKEETARYEAKASELRARDQELKKVLLVSKETEKVAASESAEAEQARERLRSSMQAFTREITRLHEEKKSVRRSLKALVSAVVGKLNGAKKGTGVGDDDVVRSLERVGADKPDLANVVAAAMTKEKKEKKELVQA